MRVITRTSRRTAKGDRKNGIYSLAVITNTEVRDFASAAAGFPSDVDKLRHHSGVRRRARDVSYMVGAQSFRSHAGPAWADVRGWMARLGATDRRRDQAALKRGHRPGRSRSHPLQT